MSLPVTSAVSTECPRGGFALPPSDSRSDQPRSWGEATGRDELAEDGASTSQAEMPLLQWRNRRLFQASLDLNLERVGVRVAVVREGGVIIKMTLPV